MNYCCVWLASTVAAWLVTDAQLQVEAHVREAEVREECVAAHYFANFWTGGQGRRAG